MAGSTLFQSCDYCFTRRYKLTRSIEKCYNNGIDTISLPDMTHFQWDSVYFFPNGYGDGDWAPIQKRLPCYTKEMWCDVGERLVFVKEGNVVYEEAWYWTDIYPKGFVFLDFTPRGFMCCGKDDAVFKVAKTTGANDYFILNLSRVHLAE